MKHEKMRIEIEWEKLELIANYYEFPVDVFLLPLKEWRKKKKKTRKNELFKIYEKYMKIEEIVKGE